MAIPYSNGSALSASSVVLPWARQARKKVAEVRVLGKRPIGGTTEAIVVDASSVTLEEDPERSSVARTSLLPKNTVRKITHFRLFGSERLTRVPNRPSEWPDAEDIALTETIDAIALVVAGIARLLGSRHRPASLAARRTEFDGSKSLISGKWI